FAEATFWTVRARLRQGQSSLLWSCCRCVSKVILIITCAWGNINRLRDTARTRIRANAQKGPPSDRNGSQASQQGKFNFPGYLPLSFPRRSFSALHVQRP